MINEFRFREEGISEGHFLRSTVEQYEAESHGFAGIGLALLADPVAMIVIPEMAQFADELNHFFAARGKAAGRDSLCWRCFDRCLIHEKCCVIEEKGELYSRLLSGGRVYGLGSVKRLHFFEAEILG